MNMDERVIRPKAELQRYLFHNYREITQIVTIIQAITISNEVTSEKQRTVWLFFDNKFCVLNVRVP